MAYIYKITNQINGKIYVGKTLSTIDNRWCEHLRDYSRSYNKIRPLYSAMIKYGVKNFSIEELEECLPEEASEREKYWIETLQSFKKGYNATVGGDGVQKYDYQLIGAMYKELHNKAEVARRLGCNESTVQRALDSEHISNLNPIYNNRIVNQYTLDGKYIQSFPSCKAAAKYLGKITGTSNGASSHISQVCKGKRKTAYGYIWKFSEN